MMRANRYDFIASLSKSCHFLSDNGHINQALRLIHDFVERIITEPLCTSQVFGSKTLGDLCQRIGKANLAEINKEIDSTTYRQPDQPIFAYVVTKLQKSGGYTRVIEDFIKAHPEAQHVILSTELAGRSWSNYIARCNRTRGGILSLCSGSALSA
jgi:hypothetical protein